MRKKTGYKRWDKGSWEGQGGNVSVSSKQQGAEGEGHQGRGTAHDARNTKTTKTTCHQQQIRNIQNFEPKYPENRGQEVVLHIFCGQCSICFVGSALFVRCFHRTHQKEIILSSAPTAASSRSTLTTHVFSSRSLCACFVCASLLPPLASAANSRLKTLRD